MVGGGRSPVNFFMNEIRQLGCIDYNGARSATTLSWAWDQAT